MLIQRIINCSKPAPETLKAIKECIVHWEGISKKIRLTETLSVHTTTPLNHFMFELSSRHSDPAAASALMHQLVKLLEQSNPHIEEIHQHFLRVHMPPNEPITTLHDYAPYASRLKKINLNHLKVLCTLISEDTKPFPHYFTPLRTQCWEVYLPINTTSVEYIWITEAGIYQFVKRRGYVDDGKMSENERLVFHFSQHFKQPIICQYLESDINELPHSISTDVAPDLEALTLSFSAEESVLHHAIKGFSPLSEVLHPTTIEEEEKIVGLYNAYTHHSHSPHSSSPPQVSSVSSVFEPSAHNKLKRQYH